MPVNQNITFQNLLDTILMLTTTTTGFDIFYTVRLRKVEVWSIAAQGTPTTVRVVFDNSTLGQFGDQKIHTDTSMGIEPAHVLARPQPKSLLANFQLSSANPAFSIECPAGSVIDVAMDFRGIPAHPVPAQNAVAASGVGSWYFRGLDGLDKTTTILASVDPITV